MMRCPAFSVPPNTTYRVDRRPPIEKLYRSFYRLASPEWIIEEIWRHQLRGDEGQKISLPAVAFTSRNGGPALWLIAGIHGEEPAGPIAVARRISVFERLQKHGIPVVLLPLCNPSGYFRNWRYPLHPIDWQSSGSIGDCEHLLPKGRQSSEPRRRTPFCRPAALFTSWVLRKIRTHPPLLAIDLHEDEPLTAAGSPPAQRVKRRGPPYLYSCGVLGARDPVAREVVAIIRRHGLRLRMRGDSGTAAGERVTGGIVEAMADSSVDELLAARRIIVRGRAAPGPAAKHVIVVETETASAGVPLALRVKVHGRIVAALPKFWRMIDGG